MATRRLSAFVVLAVLISLAFWNLVLTAKHVDLQNGADQAPFTLSEWKVNSTSLIITADDSTTSTLSQQTAPTPPSNLPKRNQPVSSITQQNFRSLPKKRRPSPILDHVHVVYASDGPQYEEGCRQSVRSIFANTKWPKRITIHIFVLNDDMARAFSQLQEDVRLSGGELVLHEYSFEEVEPFVNRHYDTEGHNLKAPGNYVRFILPRRLPDVQSCLWIDSDTIIRKDIFPFLAERDRTKAMSAFPRAPIMREIYIWQRISVKLFGEQRNMHIYSFNAGIVVLHLEYWRQNNLADRVLEICRLNDKFNLYPNYGSQPQLQAIFYAGLDYEALPNLLVQHNLGWDESLYNSSRFEHALFLHWNGPRKPWMENGLYKDLWQGLGYDKQQ